MKQLIFTSNAPLSQDNDGTARVIGSRITLDTLVGAFKNGATEGQIKDSFPSLDLTDIHGVVSYYLEHPSEVEEYLKDRREEADAVRREIESAQDSSEFRAQIGARRQ